MFEYIEQRTETANSDSRQTYEYIDKQALLDEFERWNFGKHGQLEKHFADRAFAIIDKVPTAPVAPIADIVKQMQEKLITTFCPDANYCGYDIHAAINEKAKEILEGKE